MSNSRKNRRKINVRSFDFDGCIFNSTYVYSTEEDRLIKCNESFIKFVSDEIKNEEYNNVFFIVGSNRQSYDADQVNFDSNLPHPITRERKTYIKGSCFPALNQLCEEFKKRDKQNKNIYAVNPYLLADTYGERKHGYNFESAIKKLKSKGKADFNFSQFEPDESKLNILYAQMNKMALENPDADIIFDFYDDRYAGNGGSDILQGLADFFKNNADLVPSNLTLRLHFYDGMDLPKKIAEIKGAGETDFRYEHTIRAAKFVDRDNEKYNMMEWLAQDNRLNVFKAQRKFRLSAIPMNESHAGGEIELDNQVAVPLMEFYTEHNEVLTELENHINDLESSLSSPPEQFKKGNEGKKNEKEFITALKNLHAELKSDFNKQNKLDPQAIATSAAMKTAKETNKMVSDLRAKRKTDYDDTDYRDSDIDINRIKAYEKRCKQITGGNHFLKAVAAVALAAIGLVLGAVIGAGIGIAAGAWSGPGAVVTGAIGLVKGSVTGATVGLAAGAAITGISAGALGGHLLFKSNRLAKNVDQVVKKAKQLGPSKK